MESGSWRPISLMVQIFKLFEKVLLNHAKFNSKNNHYNRQKGFRSKMGCDHALSNVTEIVEKALINRGYCLAISLDARGAFNELSFEAIFSIMKRNGIDEGLIAINGDFLKNRQMTFSDMTFRGVSLTHYCASRVPQRGVWASQLFSFCIDGLYESIDRIQTPISVHMTSSGYADDVIILSSSKNLKQAYRYAQFAINACERWGMENSLAFSSSKSFGLLFTRKQDYLNKINQFPAVLNGDQIKMVPTIKHLGLNFDRNLFFTDHFRIITARAKSAICRTANLMVVVQKLNYCGIKRLYGLL